MTSLPHHVSVHHIVSRLTVRDAARLARTCVYWRDALAGLAQRCNRMRVKVRSAQEDMLAYVPLLVEAIGRIYSNDVPLAGVFVRLGIKVPTWLDGTASVDDVMARLASLTKDDGISPKDLCQPHARLSDRCCDSLLT